MLFDLRKRIPEFTGEWKLPELPSLSNVKELYLNVEATGLKWWRRDQPVGLSVIFGDQNYYLPFGHAGGNLPEEQVKYWAQRELRGKRITNINIKFDIHMLRQWGVDLEEQGCEVADVAHQAALLDDHRQRFALDILVPEFLKIAPMPRLDESRMAEHHAGQVAPRAIYNVWAVRELEKIFRPEMTKQDLDRVRKLEEEVIFVVCEMEKNAAKIDVEKLNLWCVLIQQKIEELKWRIWKNTGLKFNPTPLHWVKLFQHERVNNTELTPGGKPSFHDSVLKNIPNENIQIARRIARLASINSKYLQKYQRTVGSDGILRFALHQLRTQKDEYDSMDVGTISGRFSSTGIDDEEGANIQQVMKVAKQRVLFGYDENDGSHDDEIFIIRELHIPEEGEHLSADAMQIEYRIFADKTRSEKLLKKYQEDPKASFHRMIEADIKPHRPKFTYRQVKDLNFATIYAAGLCKKAWMLEFITKTQFEELNREYNNRVPRSHPLLADALEIDKIYARELPEAGPLIKLASDIAAKRGYVRTLLGRRIRFPQKIRLHKALNGVIQGSAADVAKKKSVELHKERKWTGLLLRYPVHDEFDGDARIPETKVRVQEILDTQSFPQMKIPILWEVNTGKTWKDCA